MSCIPISHQQSVCISGQHPDTLIHTDTVCSIEHNHLELVALHEQTFIIQCTEKCIAQLVEGTDCIDIGTGIHVSVGICTAYWLLSLICICLPACWAVVSAVECVRKGGSDSPASVSSMWSMKIERELMLPPLSPAEREVAHPFFFSRANTLPSPSCPSRWLHHRHDSSGQGVMTLIALD